MEHDARAWRPQAFGHAAARRVPDALVEPGWDGTRVLVHVRTRTLRIEDIDGADLTARCGRIPAALADAILAESAVLDGYLTYQATRGAISTIPDAGVPTSLGGHMARFMLGGAADLVSPDRGDRWARARGESRVGTGQEPAAEDAVAAETDRRSRTPRSGDPSRMQAAGARPLATRDGPAAGPPVAAGAAQEANGADAPVAVLAFVAVDVLEIDGTPLLDVPLLERKRVLDSIIEENLLVRRTPFVREPISTFLITWRAAGFEELVYKDPNSRYTPGLPNNGWALAPMPRR